MSEFDVNKDGKLSIDEFVAALADSGFEVVMKAIAAPAGETVDDLVPVGAGCEIRKPEDRGTAAATRQSEVDCP